MNILIFSPFPTFPLNAGNRIRIYNIAKHLQKRHKIHFVYFNLGEMNYDIYTSMNHEWDSFTFIKLQKQLKNDPSDYYQVDDWYQENIGETIATLCHDLDIDIILVNYIFQSKLLEKVPDNILKIIDTHDKFTDRHLLLQQNGVDKSGWWFYTTKEEETKALNRADKVLAIQENEASFFQSITKSDVRILKHIEKENFVDKEYYKLEKIGFIGSANSVNVQSIENFIKVFLNNLKKDNISINLYLAGEISRKINITDENIHKLGFVENLKDFYSEMDLIVNPLTFGTGLKIKSVEALSFGVPIISTKIGFEGLDPNSKFHQANNLNELMSLIIEIYKNPNKLNELSKLSRKIFLEYNKSIKNQIDEIFSEKNLKKEKTDTTEYLKKEIEKKERTILNLYKELQEIKFDSQRTICNTNEFPKLLNSIQNICQISTLKNPIKKMKAYKDMIDLFHHIKDNQSVFKHFFKRKKRIAILANCQGGIYKTLLMNDKTFNNQFEFIDLPLVFTLTEEDKDKVYDIVRSIDVLFYQPLQAQKFEPFFIENLKKSMPSFSSTFSIPVLYFNFYAPHTIYVLPGESPKFDIEYHDLNILLGWYHNINTSDLLVKLNDNTYYSKELMDDISVINFSRLREREKKIDLKYADFLESKFKDKVLFHTFNHPDNEILTDMASKIALKLGFQLEVNEFTQDLLGNVKVGIYPSIKTYLNSTDLETDSSYEIHGEKVPMEKMVERYYNYYNEHRQFITSFVEKTLLKSEDEIEKLLIQNFANKYNRNLWSQ